MKQLSMFSNIPDIAGLKYIPEYITSAQEAALIQTIDQQKWITELKRRVQHYGYKYNYKSRNINSKKYLGTIPSWLDDLRQKLYADKVFDRWPNQVIVNEYTPGQGISQHVDCIPCFGDTICSLSLGSTCVMDFDRTPQKLSLLLEQKSLVILQKDARYLWQHSIAARKKDQYSGASIERGRRISLTFRMVTT